MSSKFNLLSKSAERRKKQSKEMERRKNKKAYRHVKEDRGTSGYFTDRERKIEERKKRRDSKFRRMLWGGK